MRARFFLSDGRDVYLRLAVYRVFLRPYMQGLFVTIILDNTAHVYEHTSMLCFFSVVRSVVIVTMFSAHSYGGSRCYGVLVVQLNVFVEGKWGCRTPPW